MTRSIRSALVPLLGVVMTTATPVTAQTGAEVRTSLVFENYSFTATSGDFAISSVNELTVPVAVTVPLGRIGRLTLSSGFARVHLESADPTQPDQDISGALDTEARLSFNLIPGRLLFLATGSLPTGVATVESGELPILALLATDLIGFAAANLGSGGYVGTGLAAAFPVGRGALGIATTYRRPFAYDPLQNTPLSVRPGGELRVRAGLEGPVGPRTFVRLAGIFARRDKDVVNDSTVNGIGNRISAYVSLNQGIGSASSLTIYAFDVFRSDPQLEPTATGTAFLPRGNLFAAGAQWAWSVGAVTQVSPLVEYRISSAAPDAVDTSLERVGTAVRFGAEIRHRVSPFAALVVRGSGVTGEFMQNATQIDFDGYRASLHLEIRR